ncbi:hypothetical protein EDC01DRAFT_753908 [Geopyxis carbonaria]|nr:hypothetical protein EDC01DRAFT_753908 [Geopyxis carbonaria]
MNCDNLDNSDAIARFKAWLPSAGIALHPDVAFADFSARGAGRGLVATTALPKDTLLFSLPRSAALTAAASPLTTHLTPWLSLILTLLHESANPSSQWAPYLALLPPAEGFDTLMYWTSEELRALQASAVVGKIGREETVETIRSQLWPLVREHADMFPGLATEDAVVDAAIRWGSVVMAYSFDLDTDAPAPAAATPADDDEDDTAGTVKAMLPVADLLNADADRANARLFQTPAALEMRTTAAVAAGAELLNDYGPLPRSDLLRRYGYVSDAYTPYDVVELPAPLVVEVATAAGAAAGTEVGGRVDWLLDEGLLDDAVEIDVGCEVPEEAVVCVKVLQLDAAAWEGVKAGGRAPRGRMTVEVAAVLREVVRRQLVAYGSSVEEDEALLRRGSVGRRERMAVEVRVGEKRILEALAAELGRVGRGKRGAGHEDEGGREGGEGGKRIRAG